MTKILTKDNDDRIDYDEAYNDVKAEVDKVLSTSPLAIREYTKHLTLSTGKFIRAASLLTCAMDEEDLVPKDAIKLAAAIELIHLATLVHDDIIDNAEIRRGEPSLQKKYGRRTAVICGDYILCMALCKASEVTVTDNFVKKDIPDYMSRVCLGELNQHVNNGNYNLTVYRYLKIIAGKTAALFEASFHGGALLAEEDQTTAKRYAKLGKYIGMIFQLTDDCMDFEATEQSAKKPVRSDYEQNVITLPLIHAFKKITGLRERAIGGKVSKEDADMAVKSSGGLVYTRMVAKQYYNKSLNIIENMDLSSMKRERLLSILKKSYRVF
ncbi:MAG TPA: polyprenyl synthetase family protein [Anaerovoracaceae bacterium]|nr:polyprenyl synthetase family protein [Anaerovoracaceae bacterium]